MTNIVITGGTSGVGLAFAKALNSFNNKIFIIGRNKQKGQAVEKQLGNTVEFLESDLTNTEARISVLTTLKERVGHIDVLIHSAGVWPQTALENIEINLSIHYELTKLLIPIMTNGHIFIITGNPSAIRRLPIWEVQSNSVLRAGWALTHKTLLMVYLSETLKSKKITVNAFFPGDINSDLMPYTRSLPNTDIPIANQLILKQIKYKNTGTFYDNRGNIIKLDSHKYNVNQAQIILSKYLKLR